MKSAVIYARYSSDLQRDASIEDQIRHCRQRASREGWQVVEEYTDHAMSASDLHRPGIQQLLQDLGKKPFDIILTESLDRLSRDLADMATIHKLAEFAEVKIVTLADNEVTDLLVGLKGTMNVQFLRDLAAKTRRGLRGRVAQGKSGGGNSFGYDVVHTSDASGLPIRGDRRINEDQAAIVRRIFTEYAAGASPKAIAKRLNAERVPGPRGPSWGPSTIHGNPERGTGILNNELYVGRIVWNKLRYRKDPTTGRRISRLNPKADWTTTDVPELRIVDEELWNAVKRQQSNLRSTRTGDKRPGYWNRWRPHYLFSGFTCCGHCDGGFVLLNGERLGCANARNKGTCSVHRTIRRDVLESTVLAGLQEQLMAPKLVWKPFAKNTRLTWIGFGV